MNSQMAPGSSRETDYSPDNASKRTAAHLSCIRKTTVFERMLDCSDGPFSFSMDLM